MGYRDYESFRPWLRDEFDFRCGFCLAREVWIKRARAFEIDHLIPVSSDLTLATAYHNLCYTCAHCNAMKHTFPMMDPIELDLNQHLEVGSDGVAQFRDDTGQMLIEGLCLNHPDLVRFRRAIIRLTELAKEHDTDLYSEMMGYPENLPDLSTLRPPKGNAKPEGIQDSALAKRNRGVLPSIY